MLVEIVGVAGSGKSTLSGLMSGAGAAVVADSLHTRKPGHLRYVLHGALRLVPVLSAALWRSPRASWDEVKYLIYAEEWHRYLRRERPHGRPMTVLDQGPLFAVARLETSDKPFTRTPAFRRWRHRVLATWARMLDGVVVLDAPDEALIDRVNGREQHHETKGATAELALRFIARYRRAFDGILTDVGDMHGPQALRFDTGRRSAASIAEELFGRLGGAPRAYRPLPRKESR